MCLPCSFPRRTTSSRAALLAFMLGSSACVPSRNPRTSSPDPRPPSGSVASPARSGGTAAGDEGVEARGVPGSAERIVEREAGPELIALPAPAPEERYPFNDPLPVPGFAPDAPALRIANLSPAACRAELARRTLPVKRFGGATPGIATAVRLTGPLGGVRFLAPGGKSPYGLLDCRLALLIDELAPLLAEHGVSAVRADNFYRPRAHLPGRRRTPSQHAHGLAIDVTGFVLTDGRTLDVEREWPADIGAPACGPEARASAPTDAAIALRNLVCEVARRGFFHDVLTPNYDRAHRNHIHMDIKRGVRTASVR